MTGNSTTYEVRAGAALLTLARPEVLNAIDQQMQSEISHWLDVAEADPAVSCLILTGDGRAFAAGADISQLQGYGTEAGLAAHMQRLYDRVERSSLITIAAVNGYALGGGCELAMACDIRISSTAAKFGLPETMLGVLPGAGGTQRLARMIGVGRAVHMILTGRQIAADDALAFGLVTAVHEPADLTSQAWDIAATILKRGPLATRLASIVVKSATDTDLATGQLIERLAQSVLYGSPEKTEGTQAFLEKRSPDFGSVS